MLLIGPLAELHMLLNGPLDVLHILLKCALAK